MAYNLTDILNDMLQRKLAAPGSFGMPMSPVNNAAPVDPQEAFIRDAFMPYQPTPFEESPRTGKEKFGEALAGLADIFKAKAYARGASTPPDVLEKLRERRSARERDVYATKEQGRKLEHTTKQQRAMYELGRLDRKESAEAALQEKEAERTFASGEKEKDRLSDKDIAAMRFEADTRARDIAFEREKELLALKNQYDLRELRARQSVQKDDTDRVAEREIARETRESVKEAKSNVLAVKSNIDEAIAQAGGPDGVREQFLDQIDVLGLKGEARDEVIQFFKDRIEPLLSKAESDSAKRSESQSRTFDPNPLVRIGAGFLGR